MNPARRVPLLLSSLMVAVSLLALPAAALARSIFLNDQNIDSVRDQTFEGVDVVIDANGNIVIKSDKYRIEGASAGNGTTSDAVALPTPQPERFPHIPRGLRYWLVSEENAPGASQYDFDVFVNGNLVKTVRSGEGQVVEDVSRFVVPGENVVTITARKNFGTGRKSDSKDIFHRLYLGRGALNESGAIVIDAPDVDYRRTAADVENFSDQLGFTVK